MSASVEELVRVYGSVSASGIARANGVEGDEPLATLETLWKDKVGRQAAVNSLAEEARGLLAFIDQIGRRLRGERLKKRWFLHGYDDFEGRIEPLISRGLILIGNTSAREALSLESALEQGLLQQWVQVTPGFEGLAGDPPEQREVVEQIEDETTIETSRRLFIFEFNVLNAALFLEKHRIRLNRDGSPHRSDLKALSPTIIDPVIGRADTIPDPNTHNGWDTLVFTLSVAEALGLIHRRNDVLRATGQGMDYFLRPLDDRLPILSRALDGSRAWSELDASSWYTTKEPPITGQGQAAFLEEGGPGAQLGGPRGSILSALRRLTPPDWFDVEETVRTITGLEQAYLATALPVPTGDAASLPIFVRAYLTLTLSHVGAVELGRSSDGRARARLTPIGRALVSGGEVPVEPDGSTAIVVDPSQEITGVLEATNLRLLYDLSRFAELTKTGEHVARWRLTGESVQWGYARGFTADSLTQLLQKHSNQPVPDSVLFALQDWERLHRRVTVHVRGSIVAASGRTDPEVLQQGLSFSHQNVGEGFETIDIHHSWITHGYQEITDRTLTAYKPRVIDYDGAIVPSLTWIDERRLRAPIGETDLRLLARLQRIAEAEDDETFRLEEKSIRSAWNQEPFENLVRFLRSGLIEGLSAERELALKQILGEKTRVSVEQMEVLVVTSQEDGNLLARIDAARPHIAQRLGPRAFQLVPGMRAALLDILSSHGVRVEG